jgi:succinoglycan biosynthesis transport protein ExoP
MSRHFLPEPDAAETGLARPDASRTSENGHLIDYLRVLSRRRYWVILTFLLTVGVVAVYTEMVTPMYEARVQLMIEDPRPKVSLFKDTVEHDNDKLDYQQTQMAILQSRSLARRTLDTLQLWNNREFVGDPNKSPSLLNRSMDTAWSMMSGAAGGFIPSAVHKTPAATGDDAPETALQSRAIDAFLNRLSVTPIKNSRLVNVAIQAEDPKVAADAANALADGYAKENLEYRTTASTEAVDWLTSQLDSQRQRVEVSQAALQRYREKTESVSTDSRDNIVMQRLNDLNAAVTQARTERIQKEALYEQVAHFRDPSQLDAVPAVMTNTFIQAVKTELAQFQRQQTEMKKTFGPRHPDMVKLQDSIDATQAKLRVEIQKVAEALHNDYLAAAAREKSLITAAESQKREALAQRRSQIEYEALDHAASSDQQIFETLLQRAKETGLSGQSLGSNVRVIDSADPPRVPVTPRKDRNALIAILGGSILGVCMGFFVDYFDKRIQTPDEVTAQLGLPCLGLVPLVDHAHNIRPLVSDGVPARFKESFRRVRTNVLFALGTDKVRTVLVTSTGPSEGKTLVASNLAIALAQTGQRVLLIDADLRRPSIHRAFNQRQDFGLSDVIKNGATASKVIRGSETPNLWLLTAGSEGVSPAELLSSPKVRDLLATLSAEFDWIVIDSPPVMAVTDASLIANVAGGVLFVVAAEKTMGPSALNALGELNGAGARFVGAILNGVNLDRYAFFYSSYYKHEYDKYYVTRTVS